MSKRMDEENEMIVPGNGRAIQKRRCAKRARFGKKRKEAFIEVLAQSCNVAAAAEETAVCVSTVYAHRRSDPEFRELWWLALEQGAAKLAALRLQYELERSERAVEARRGNKAAGESGKEAGLTVTLDGPPDARQIADLYKLLQLFREHGAGLAGEAKQAGRTPEKASLAETCRVLSKQLKKVEARIAAGRGRAA